MFYCGVVDVASLGLGWVCFCLGCSGLVGFVGCCYCFDVLLLRLCLIVLVTSFLFVCAIFLVCCLLGILLDLDYCYLFWLLVLLLVGSILVVVCELFGLI